MNLKSVLKNSLKLFITPFFKRRRYFGFLKYYFRGRNYVFDIINFYQNNNLQVIIDVGANIGQSAKEFRNYFNNARIYCFEPVVTTFKELVKNLKNEKDIFCENIALGNSIGEKEIKLSSDSGLNSLVDEVNNFFDASNRQVVNILTLDKYINDKALEHINLIKIDTEGFDLNVLMGAEETLLKGKIDFIVCEIGFLYEKSKGNFEDINRFLQGKGYYLVGIYDNYYWGTRNILHGFANALFINKELAFS